MGGGLAVRFAAAAGAAGAALRLRELLGRRSLWLDEAMLANNVVRRGWWRLTEPLDDNQGAPVGFLWAQRAAVNAFGDNEYAHRALPFVAGLAVLVLVYLVARRLASARVAAAAVALAALCPPLVRYAAEAKQYSVDAAVALAVTWLALRARDPGPQGGGGGTRAVAAWGAGSAAAVWLSHYAVFVVAGTAAVLVASLAGRRRAAAVAGAAAAAVSFAALYALSLRELGANPVLTGYWAAGFPPPGAGAGSAGAWLARRVPAVLGGTAGFRPAALAGALVVAGAATLWAAPGRRRALALLAAPSAVLVAAAGARAYPLAGRLALGAVPALVVLAAAGLDARPRWARAAAGAGVAVLAAGWLGPAASIVRSPTTIAEIRPVLEEVAARFGPGDHLVVHDVTEPPARYYGAHLGLVPERRLVWQPAGPACAGGPARERAEVFPAGGSGRVWVVYAYRLSTRPPDEAAQVFARLDGLARRRATVVGPGASAALYDLGAPPARAPAPPAGALGCLGAFVLE